MYIDGYLQVHMGQRQEACAFLFDYIGREDAPRQIEMVEVLDRPAYFNCRTGVLNEEAHSFNPFNAEGYNKKEGDERIIWEGKKNNKKTEENIKAPDRWSFNQFINCLWNQVGPCCKGGKKSSSILWKSESV